MELSMRESIMKERKKVKENLVGLMDQIIEVHLRTIILKDTVSFILMYRSL